MNEIENAQKRKGREKKSGTRKRKKSRQNQFLSCADVGFRGQSLIKTPPKKLSKYLIIQVVAFFFEGPVELLAGFCAGTDISEPGGHCIADVVAAALF